MRCSLTLGIIKLGNNIKVNVRADSTGFFTRTVRCGDGLAAGLRRRAERACRLFFELDDALDRLTNEFPVAADLVKLRLFAGPSPTAIATSLGSSATRTWACSASGPISGS